MFLQYKPVTERTPDFQYQAALKRITNEGFYTRNISQTHGRYAHYWLSPLVYHLDNGIPLITERAIPFWKKAIGEVLAFIHGVRYLEDMNEWGCANFWEKSVTKEKCADFGLEESDLGSASYGPILHDFPMKDGTTFNQFYHLIKGIRWRPGMATHMVTTWYPPGALQHDELQRKVVVAPCHGSLIKASIVELNEQPKEGEPLGKLIFHHVQRSWDGPIGGPGNIFQWSAIAVMMGHVTRMIPHTYVHTLLDAQIYENQGKSVEELTSREPRTFPSLYLTEEGERVTDLFDFRPHHFELRDYNPHPAIKDIPYTV